MKYLTAVLLLLNISTQVFAQDAQNTQTNQTTQTASSENTVIQLQHRTPEDLIPVLKPFLDKNGQISEFENKIIIQTSPQNLITLQKMIKDLDTPVKQLMISVSNGYDEPSGVATDNQGDVNFGTQDRPGNQVYGTTRDEDTQVNHIRVMDGHVAFIDTGVTIPLIKDQFVGSDVSNLNGNIGGGVIGDGQIHGSEIANAYGKSVDYKNLTNGIFVKPSVVGSQVRMQLLTKNDQPIVNQNSDTSPVYTTLKTDSTIMVPLGKWVYMGGNRDRNEMGSGNVYRTQSREQSQKNLWIKVDVISE